MKTRYYKLLLSIIILGITSCSKMSDSPIGLDIGENKTDVEKIISSKVPPFQLNKVSEIEWHIENFPIDNDMFSMIILFDNSIVTEIDLKKEIYNDDALKSLLSAYKTKFKSIYGTEYVSSYMNTQWLLKNKRVIIGAVDNSSNGQKIYDFIVSIKKH